MTADSRRRLLLLVGVVITLWAVWQVRDADEPALRSVPARHSRAETTVASAAADPGAALSLPERAKASEPVRDLFQIPLPPAPPKSTRRPAPVAPPLPYGYLGGISDGSGAQVFLSDGTNTLVAKPGSRLAGGWLLEAIEPGHLVFNYETLQQRQSLPIGVPR